VNAEGWLNAEAACIGHKLVYIPLCIEIIALATQLGLPFEALPQLSIN